YPAARKACAASSERWPNWQISRISASAPGRWRAGSASSAARSMASAPSAWPDTRSCAWRMSISSAPRRWRSRAWAGVISNVSMPGLSPARRSLAALDVADQPPLARDLALAQLVLLAFVGVGTLAEQHPHRRADQLETLAEEILQVAPVGVRERLEPGAVDDEGRRVLATRVHRPQPGGAAAHRRRRLGLHRHLQRLVGLAGPEAADGRGVGAMHGPEQFTQARAVLGRDPHRLGPGHEAQLAVEQRLGLLALVVAEPVPLVHRHHQRAAGV